jgi:fermentation-respiration switch protein FrsA (DUF1100 family)
MTLAVPQELDRPRRRFALRHVLIALVALAVAIYAGIVVRLMVQETQLVFRTNVARADTHPRFPYVQVDLPRRDGLRQFAWVMRRDAAQPAGRDADLWVLFLHGNAATIGSRSNVAHYTGLHQLGVNVLAPEYRGFNGLDGVPTEAAVGTDARTAYDYLRVHEGVPADRLIIYGWSLGAAIAVDLASQVEARAVVLEGAPASVVDIGQQRYPLIPVKYIIRNPFQAIRKIGLVKAPLLFLHSPEDRVVPFAEGRRLFEAAPAPKTFVEVHGGHVEASEADRDHFYGAITKFLGLASILDAGAAASHALR